MKKILETIDRIIMWIEDIGCTASLLSIICLCSAQVVLRYVFKSGILWVDEVNTALIVALAMFGCAKAVRMNSHTELTSLINKPKNPKVRIALRAVVNIISLIVLIVLFVESCKYTASGATIKSVMLRIPRMYFYVSMPIGLGMSIYEFIKIMPFRIMEDPKEEF